MKKKQFSEEQIVRNLWDVETTMVEEAAWHHGVSELVDLSMEAAVWADGGGRCASVAPAAAGECQVETSLGRARRGGGGDERTPRKQVVSPQARRPIAHMIYARGLSARRAVWLCTTAQAGMGYRVAGSFLRQRGWRVNLKRIHRVWHQQGLQVPIQKPRKKVVTGTTLQPTAKPKNDVWSWDFVHDGTSSGESVRCVTVKDEATRLCVAIEVDRALSHQRVIAVLQRLLVLDGPPRYVRSENGPKLGAQT